MSDSLQPYGLSPTKLLCLWDSPGKNTEVGCHTLLQGIFPTQGLNPHLLSLLLTTWEDSSSATWKAHSSEETSDATSFLTMFSHMVGFTTSFPEFYAILLHLIPRHSLGFPIGGS